MKHSLNAEYTKNYCNRTLNVQFIVEIFLELCSVPCNRSFICVYGASLSDEE